MAAERIVLDINVMAPAFVLRDIFGRMIDLESYRGRKVLICFFRHAGCPFCNLRVHALQKKYEQWKEAGLEMIFFFESKERVLLSSLFHREVSPIPLIADPEKVWYSAYGIENSSMKSAVSHLTGFIQTAIKAKLQGLPMHMMSGSESISTMPAEFLLDQQLVIRKVHYSKGLNDRMSLEYIEAFAERQSDAGISVVF
jgi:thioredoxin-dependent peroxiredoxin